MKLKRGLKIVKNIVKIVIKETETTIDYSKKHFKSRRDAINGTISHLLSILDKYKH